MPHDAPAGHCAVADDDSRLLSENEETAATQLSCDTPAGLVDLPRPDGLTTAEVVALLRNPSQSNVLLRIPNGRKNDVYFSVSNTRNVDRQRNGQPNIFVDDCGVWEKQTARYNKYPYMQLESGFLKRVFWIAGLNKYCRETKSSGKHAYIPLEPQPSRGEIITLVRYTLKLVANKDYRRRITWLVTDDETPSDVAVVEYFGQHVVGAPHGLCKDKTVREPYVRTPADTMEAILSLTKQQSAKAVYNK